MNRLLEGFFGGGNTAAQNEGATPASGSNPIAGLGASDLARGLGQHIPGGLGGVAAGGVIGLLLGNRKARKVAGKAVVYGGLATVGVLAYRAWQNSRNAPPPAGAQQAPLALPPADSGFDPTGQNDGEGADFRLTLLKAMISAANADGHIDAAERAALQQQIDNSALASDEKAFLFDQMNRPSDPIGLAKLAATEQQAAEIYLASGLTIDPDTPEEQRYLQRLGDALRLDSSLRVELDRQAEAARQG